MSVHTGGGWYISTTGVDSNYNAFCYAGNGCSLIDLYDPTPLTVRKVGEIEKLALEFGKDNACGTSRLDDRSSVSDERTICKSGVTPGSVRVCRSSQSTDQTLLCGEKSLLAFQREGGKPTEEQLVIEHHSISNLDLLSAKTPGAVWTDGNCIKMGAKIYCDPGLTYLFAFPHHFWCEGSFDDLLGFWCETIDTYPRGFTLTGCCSEELNFTALPSGEPAAIPSKTPIMDPTAATPPPTNTSTMDPTRTSSDMPSAAPSSNGVFNIYPNIQMQNLLQIVAGILAGAYMMCF